MPALRHYLARFLAKNFATTKKCIFALRKPSHDAKSGLAERPAYPFGYKKPPEAKCVRPLAVSDLAKAEEVPLL